MPSDVEGSSPARKTIAAKAFYLTTLRREPGAISTSSSTKLTSMPISLAYNATSMREDCAGALGARRFRLRASFESWIIELAKHLLVAVIARMVEEHDTRLWRFIHYYVDKARALEDYSEVTNIGMDETSKKGHNYITVVADLSQFVTDGKDFAVVRRFVRDFEAHQDKVERVRRITCDMSLGFRKGIRESFENSQTIIDKFHVIKHANEAMDKVRKMEAKENVLLENSKYLWLKNDANLTEKQRQKKEALQKKPLKTARACAMRIELQEIYEQSTHRDEAEEHLKKLCSWMMHARLEPMKKLCGTIRNHWNEILHYFEHPYTNAILEGLNSII